MNWHLNFFKRNGHMQSKLSRPFAKARVMQENADVYIEFFERYLMLVEKWKIQSKDTYDMDESGCSIGLHQKSRVIVPAEEADAIAIAATDGNREWVTLFETICASGSDLTGKTFFKIVSI